MNRQHSYRLQLTWTGNDGDGTATYRSYRRDHVVTADGKPPIDGSSDAVFYGDRARWNPEELLVAALAQCHMLTYLHLASSAGVVVLDYADEPEGVMVEDASGGGGQFSRVTLKPQVAVATRDMVETADQLHADVPAMCFITRSVSFPVDHDPTTRVV